MQIRTGGYTIAMDGSDLAKARRLYAATRTLHFADLPTIDLKDRLSVLTVAAGLRRVGVLETWGQRLPQIRDRIVQNGLATAVAACVWSRIERPEDTPYCEVLNALDERRVAGKPRHVLWLYPAAQARDEFRQMNYTQQLAGRLLGYPDCCIAFESAVMALLPAAQLRAMILQLGENEAALLRAARKGPLPEVSKPALPDNAVRTEQRLPFVLHVACDNCLEDMDSPSARLNTLYKELAREVDADFHDLFCEVQQTYCQITREPEKTRELLARARMMHMKFFSSLR
ncbi:MAG TPA: hypothetical protein VG714_00450 [Acidobacteriaceae bacterium]|nr:hypothetical protein [Acidobacteriaceae bacterium]